MEQFFTYMIKASGLIALFYAAYHIFLRKETFFVSNRWFLLSGLGTALALPLVFFKKIVWIDPAPQQEMQVIDVSQLLQLQDNTQQVTPSPVSFSWPNVVLGIYIAAVLFLMIKLLFNFISLRQIIKNQTVTKEGQYKLIDTPRVNAPFSFFNYIVYNSALLQSNELESIICHEKVHSRQYHSADMLIGQLIAIFFWFNPFAWLYKSSISQNLEFIADAVATKQISDSTAYQKTMLKITLQPEYISITNHFYQSLIKKRIVMLNKKKSGKVNSWKYAIVLPVLIAFMVLFQIRVIAQEKSTDKAIEEVSYEKFKMALEITKDATDAELEKIKELFKKEFGANVTFSNLTRNSNNEITAIKVTVNDGNQSKVYQTNSTQPINRFEIAIESNEDTGNKIAFNALPVNDQYQNYANSYYQDEPDMMAPPTPPAPMTPNSMIAPPAPPAPPAAPGMSYISPSPQNGLQIINSDNKDVLVIVNGVKQQKGSTVTIPQGQIVSNINVITGKEAKKKYDKEAKDGVLVVTTQSGGGYSIKMPKGMVLDMDMIQDFSIDPISMMDMEALAQLDGEMAKRVEEQMKRVEEMSQADKIRMKEQIERGLVQLKRSEAQIARDMERAEQRRLQMEERRTEILARKEELKENAEEKREELKKRLEERKKHFEERGGAIDKMKAEQQKEIAEQRKEMEEMKKEMEIARKEIEESRKLLKEELEKINTEKEE
ncbi:M48 family metalloprotease [Flavobacterium rakeshii]|uniref:M48 family metalloprotease n=1 Tax=Flavobacterium rakeshii TaxID=1038845 RepID=A0A6N8H9J5_9FLAO|nr:M56 family metallopeptidase [Flavobacterium rakeshii]MUV02972.1 M48 family metalloprotease [Flavobacterium rakeshii]